jgi:hypothetical protein
MDYLNINRQLLEQLAEITASMERITKGESAHPLDKDLLLNQIRDLYSTALKIGNVVEEKKVAEPAPVVEQDEPHTLTPEELQVLNKAKEGVEKQEAEKEPENENIDYESYMDVHEPFDEPVPEPEPEPELPVNEELVTTPEPEMKDEAKLYGPPPQDFKELQPQDSFEEETPEPEPAAELENTGETELYGPLPEEFKEIEPQDKDEEETPEPEPEPVAQKEENSQNITEIVMNRKSAIENIVSQQHNITAAREATPQPQPKTPVNDNQQSNEEQPQLSLLDYLSSGVSRVVETVTPQPQKPEPAIHTDTLNTPAPTPTPAPESTPAPVVPQQTPAAPAAPKFTDLRSLIGINDKFTFINDLFEKDMRNYNEFINALNKIEDLGEAQSFVQQNATIHNWDKESMAVQLFMSVYKRRYSAPLILA